MRHCEVIDKLGGIGPVATRLRRHRTRVGNWRRHGIPPLLWPEIVAFARERKVSGITFEALMAGRDDDAPVAPLRRGRPARAVAQPQQAGAD